MIAINKKGVIPAALFALIFALQAYSCKSYVGYAITEAPFYFYLQLLAAAFFGIAVVAALLPACDRQGVKTALCACMGLYLLFCGLYFDYEAIVLAAIIPNNTELYAGYLLLGAKAVFIVAALLLYCLPKNEKGAEEKIKKAKNKEKTV